MAALDLRSALDLRADFGRFRAANPERINLAAHSHHDWPDVTYEAQMRCWNDAARLANRKWEFVFGALIPSLQHSIATILNLPDPSTIAFAPNTHELVGRILSCFPPERPIRILSTDAEFHSFRRQAARLVEDGLVTLVAVAAEPCASFPERFRKAAAGGGHDLVFISQVFFASGATCGAVDDVVAAVPDPASFIVIDGYHGFMACPVDLANVAHRAFYIAGGYKYAMAGEGVCFVHCPPGYGLRPRDTGWFAEFGTLATASGKTVGYPTDGARFWGATFDPVGMYRLRAVFDWMSARDLDVVRVHAHATALMAHFLNRLEQLGVAAIGRRNLVTPFGDPRRHGNFLSFETPEAGAITAALAGAGIEADHRGDRMRFGFGVALARDDVEQATVRIARVLGRY